MKFIAVISIVLSVLFSFTSCNTLSSVDKLLSPPKLTELQADLLNALEQGLKTSVGNVILKYPNYGVGDEINRKAFILGDIDGDGVEETIVFHQSKETNGAEIIMNVLDIQDGEWVWVCDTEQRINTEYSRSEILNVIFEDLNGDGKNEIITEWSLSTSTNRCYIIMNYIQDENGSSIVMVDAKEYSRLLVCDLDQDGQRDIFTAYINFVEKSSFARIYKMQEDGSVITAMETQMDGSVTSYAPFICNKLYGTQTSAIYIDGYKSNNEMITEVIYCREGRNGKELHNPFYIAPTETPTGDTETKQTGVVIATFRTIPALTVDINNDGYLDIPFCESLPLPTAEATNTNMAEATQETVYLTAYGSYTGNEILYVGDTMSKIYSYNSNDGFYKLNPQGFTNINSYIIITKDEYRLKFPVIWQGHITARYNTAARSLILSEWNSSVGASGNDLIEIRTFSLTDWSKNSADYMTDGYSLLNEGEDGKKYVYAVKELNKVQNGIVYISKGLIINNFDIIEE